MPTISCAVSRDKFIEVEVQPRDLAPSGNLAITANRHRVYDVTHVPTGFRVPMMAHGVDLGDAPGVRGAFRTKTSARRVMLLLDAALDLSTDNPREAANAIRAWLEARA